MNRERGTALCSKRGLRSGSAALPWLCRTKPGVDERVPFWAGFELVGDMVRSCKSAIAGDTSTQRRGYISIVVASLCRGVRFRAVAPREGWRYLLFAFM